MLKLGVKDPTFENPAVRWLEHRGKRVLYIDLRRAPDEGALLGLFEEARRFGAADYERARSKHPVLVDFTGVEISEKLMEGVNALGRSSSHRLGRMGVIGLTGIKRIFLTAYNLYTGQMVRPFETIDEALEWLTE
jgi:hypothetical protein